jgi:hypothetical protein
MTATSWRRPSAVVMEDLAPYDSSCSSGCHLGPLPVTLPVLPPAHLHAVYLRGESFWPRDAGAERAQCAVDHVLRDMHQLSSWLLDARLCPCPQVAYAIFNAAYCLNGGRDGDGQPYIYGVLQVS